jgi:glycine amidinotransferase
MDVVVDGPGQSEVADQRPGNVWPAVHSWDEFTTLREVVIGNAANAWMPPADVSVWLSCFPQLSRAELAAVHRGRYPRQVIEESNEDLEALAETLRGLGVKTHRMPALDHSAVLTSPDWSTEGFYSYCPRDLTLILGSAIIETPSATRSRYFELASLRPLFQQYMLEGALWLSAPRPRLDDSLYEWDETGRPLLGEAEPVFDAANILRLGKDVFYQVSRSGNEMGLKWLRSAVRLLEGDLRVHSLRGVYENTHIDSTISLLRPGLALLNPARIRGDAVPDWLRGWAIIWCPQPAPKPTYLPHPLSEEWISMNLLMVNPELAIVDASHPELIRALEGHGIHVLPHQLRHARVLGGGFHCVTLDIVRDGGPEDYLI